MGVAGSRARFASITANKGTTGQWTSPGMEKGGSSRCPVQRSKADSICLTECVQLGELAISDFRSMDVNRKAR